MEGLYFASGVDQNFVKDVNKMMASMDALKNKTVKSTAQMEDSFSKLQKRALQIFSGVAITSFIKQTIEVRNEIENLTNAFTVMLKSREKANQLMKDIVTTAATTPFSVLDLAGASKQLLAFGQDSETMIGTLRRLGDVASASGSNIGEVTAVYGKVMGKGKLELEQLNALTERGIPVLQELAKMHDTNTQSILKMISEGKIGFADLQQSIFNLTAEGGKFYNMMQTQSATVSGLMSNLGDQYDQMLNEIGQSQTSTITTTIKLLSTLLDHWEAIASTIGVAVVAYGSYKAVVMTMSAFNEAKMIMSTVQSLGFLTASLGSATVAQAGLNTTMALNPLGATVALISALVAGLVIFGDWSTDTEKKLKDLAEASDESNKKIAKSFDELKKKLNKANLSDTEVLNIKKEMIKMYPKELDYIKDQKLTSSQLLDIWEKIEKTHQDLGNIDINNNAIKELEIQAKHLEAIAKGMADDDISGIFDVGFTNINGVNVSNKVIEEYDRIKLALVDLYAKNDELNKNADADAQKRLDDAETERQKKISELQKTNELEYQLKVNNANKMYGADVDNAVKLKDALYRIELDYIDKQLKAIDEQNKGKMTKELELQKAQLEAKKIGLINQDKLDTEAKIRKDRLENLNNRYATVEKFNTILKNRASYTSNIKPMLPPDENKDENKDKSKLHVYGISFKDKKDVESLLVSELEKIKSAYYFEKNSYELNIKKLEEEKKIEESRKIQTEESKKNIDNLQREIILNKTILQDLTNQNEYTSKILNDNKTLDIQKREKNSLDTYKRNLTLIKNNPTDDELSATMRLLEVLSDESERYTKNIIKGMVSSSIAVANLNDEISDMDKEFNKVLKTNDRAKIKQAIDNQINLLEEKKNKYQKVIDDYKVAYKNKTGQDATDLSILDVPNMTGDKYQEAISNLETLNKKIEEVTENSKKLKLEFSSTDIKDLENINSELFKTIDLLKSVDDTNLNNFIEVMSNATTSAFQLADIILKLQVSTSKLQKFGLYMAAIGVVLNFMTMIDEAQKKAEENRDKALANELKYQYEITDQKIKQLALYEQGNEFYSSDNFGSTLASLDAYNEALIKQNDLLLEIKQNAGVTDYDKGIVNFMRSEKQDRGEAKDEALQQSTLNKQALASIEIRTKERSKLGSALGFKDKYSDVLSLYPQVVSANDQINYGILENIIATEDLSDADKQRLQNLVDNNKLAIESYKKFGEYVSGIFGGVGESVTDSFQNAYENMNNFADAGVEAMKSLELAMSDMIENMTNDVIENAILQPLINQLNMVNKALGEEYAKSNKTEADITKFQSGILTSLGNFYSQVNDSQSIILDTYQKADNLAKEAGFDSVFNSGTTTKSDNSGTGNVVGASITQEVSNEIVARVSGIYLNTEHMLKIQRDASDLAMKANLYLSNISANSNYLISIDDRLKKMNDKL